MNKKNIKNVLISVTAHLGDFIWATSAIALLKKTFPDIKITVLAPKTIKELISENPVIDDVIYSPFSFNDTASRIKKIFWAIKTIPVVFFRRFDALLNFDSSKVSILLAKLTFIPYIIGADLYFAGYDIADPVAKYYTHSIALPKDQDAMHIALRYQTIIKSYFGIYNNALPVLPTPKEKIVEKAASLIKNKQNLNIAICLRGSKNSMHVWDIENFKTVIEKLNSSHKNIDFYLVGGKSEFEYSQSVIDKPNMHNLCGQTSPLEAVEFFKHIDLLISVDTGTIHMAAAAGTNIVSLHGVTLPSKTGPLSHKAVTLYSKIDCSPCSYNMFINVLPCPHLPLPKCINNIIPDKVIYESLNILEKIKK